MTTLNDDIFKGSKQPTNGFFADFLITGTTESVEDKLKEDGWDGKSPRASIIILFDSSEVRNVQLVISGKIDIGKVLATTLWGSDQDSSSYVKFESLDLAIPIFINRMTSDWINSNVNWNLKIKNHDSGYFKVIPKTDSKVLEENGATDINMKVHVQLDQGPKLLGRIGVAPINNVTNIVGNNRDVFPLIQVGEQFTIDFFPQECADLELGLGVIPFFVHVGEEGDGRNAIPNIREVKTSISEFFNHTHLVKMKKKFSTWTNVYTQGNWEEMDPKYWWPSFSSSCPGNNEQGKINTINISREMFSYNQSIRNQSVILL